ncbi:MULTISPECIES: flagellin [Lysinibacillus]|uniref:flagellin N-terminal helical domain-containing protein n=1 Tax=Lysinibacillus TaxID=400634 RepID=UPI0025880DF7|nr:MULTISPECIES: flagellin [Lysinibacillus]
MRIQHNISALNTHRNLAFNNTQTSKALEKLSSGFKINRAGDDAAGLAISEKMRGQIRGLDMASKNSQDGISLIQTTEGALNETHSILQRMRELAVQAGNDTNTTGDREEIQKEINQLTSEINRIGNTTEFNTKKLLNGDLSSQFGGTSKTVSTTLAKDGTVTVAGKSSVAWSDSGNSADFKVSITGKADNGFDWSKISGSGTIEIENTGSGFTLKTNGLADSGGLTLSGLTTDLSYDKSTDTYSYDSQGIKFSFTGEQAKNWKAGEKATITVKGNATTGDYDLSDKPRLTDAAISGGDAVMGNITVSGSKLDGLSSVKVAHDGTASGKVTVTLQNASGTALATYEFNGVTSGTDLDFSADGISFKFTAGSGAASGTFKLETETKTETVKENTEDKSLKFQIGANEHQALSVSVEDMRASALGIVGAGKGFTSDKTVNDGTNATGIESALDLSSHENAANAVTVLDAAISKVSSERAKLGAVQNRLEHTINNLGASSENLTAAESRIRDTDMAASMMEFTKNNILTQAAQSMLAQANQQPQGVLQLLG